MAEIDVLIVGGGLAGLACAAELMKRNKSFRVLEASSEVGGRVKTDLVDGFRLDRGFQVFLTAYPEAQNVLDYSSLNFKKFKSGALIRFGGEFCRISDVVRHPGDLPGNLFSKAASISDKLKIASLRSEVAKLTIDEISQLKNVTTRQRLEAFGFSDRIIGSFFRPFFGGVFLESELNTSRRMFDFVFKMFAVGDVVVPEMGMGEISKQMAAALPADSIELNCTVKRLAEDHIEIVDGRMISANQIIVATDQRGASNLLEREPVRSCGVSCLYFAANQSPVNEPIIVLNGDELDAPINNLCCLSDVSTNYAPDGQALISVSVLGVDHGESLLDRVKEQAKQWFGRQAETWRHLKTYEIRDALPSQQCDRLEPVQKPITSNTGVVRCGDYLDFASIQGALQTGRAAAEAIS